MKTRVLIRLALTLCVALALAACSKTPEDLLAHGGFEPQSDLQKSPAGWFATVVPETEDFVRFAWDDQVKHTGERSVSIAIDPAHPEGVIAYNWTETVPGFEVGKSYELSGWVRTENMTGPAWIVAQCWDDSRGKMLAFGTTQTDYPISGTTDWTRVGTVFTVPAGTAEVRIRAGIVAPENNGGRAWFDDLAVREVP